MGRRIDISQGHATQDRQTSLPHGMTNYIYTDKWARRPPEGDKHSENDDMSRNIRNSEKSIKKQNEGQGGCEYYQQRQKDETTGWVGGGGMFVELQNY